MPDPDKKQPKEALRAPAPDKKSGPEAARLTPSEKKAPPDAAGAAGPKPSKDSARGQAYSVADGPITASVSIGKAGGEHIQTYYLAVPQWKAGTEAFIEDIKSALLRQITISAQEALNLKVLDELRAKFAKTGSEMVAAALPHLSSSEVDAISWRIVQQMLGLGDIEFLLRDDQIEEICVNSAARPIWVYHRAHGWLPTNLIIPEENQIWNYASSIARGVGRVVNTQSPLLDAYLATGDRVNATLFPISNFGNTITIRKFARKPWTICDYIQTKTISSETAALLWLAVQYEMNLLVCGGTGAGKTSLLNVLSMFFPQNQRVVSIEQTREITLPSHLQWVPLVVREATAEGRGSISMLDLMVNSLRMRPDRIIVGEIRRSEEAEVLFEAMHTGHSVYSTLHAETVSEAVRRLSNPPISIPPVMLESLHLVVAMYRDRRNNRRRVLEIGEIVPTEREGIEQNILFRWRPYSDQLAEADPSVRLMEALKTYTNMDDDDIRVELANRKTVLDWMVKRNVNSVEGVGEVVSAYYDDPAFVLDKVKGA